MTTYRVKFDGLQIDFPRLYDALSFRSGIEDGMIMIVENGEEIGFY